MEQRLAVDFCLGVSPVSVCGVVFLLLLPVGVAFGVECCQRRDSIFGRCTPSCLVRQSINFKRNMFVENILQTASIAADCRGGKYSLRISRNF